MLERDPNLECLEPRIAALEASGRRLRAACAALALVLASSVGWSLFWRTRAPRDLVVRDGRNSAVLSADGLTFHRDSKQTAALASAHSGAPIGVTLGPLLLGADVPDARLQLFVGGEHERNSSAMADAELLSLDDGPNRIDISDQSFTLQRGHDSSLFIGTTQSMKNTQGEIRVHSGSDAFALLGHDGRATLDFATSGLKLEIYDGHELTLSPSGSEPGPNE